MIQSGLNLMHSFSAPSGEAYSGFLQYMDRKKATNHYDGYLGYMDAPDKRASLFTATSDGLTKKEKKELRDIFDRAQESDSVLFEDVISFDNEWLHKHNLYDPETNTVDENTLRRLTRGAVKKLHDREGLDNTAVWAAAIHYNTDNIHIHIATVEPNPTREKKTYRTLQFSKRWLEDHGVMDAERYGQIHKGKFVVAAKDKTTYAPILRDLRNQVQEETGVPFFCQSGMYFDRFGNLRISVSDAVKRLPKDVKIVREEERYDGKFKQSSMEAAKRYMVNEVINTRDTNLEINRIVREDMIEPLRKRASGGFAFDKELLKDFQGIRNSLEGSGIPPNQWNYSMNKLSYIRDDLDAMTDKYIQKYHKKEWETFERNLDRVSKEYTEAYGGDKGKRYKETKIQDARKRIGNAILAEARNQHYLEGRRKKKKRRPRRFSSYHQSYRRQSNSDYELRRVVHRLMWALDNTWEQEQNMRAYERMEQEIEEGRSYD